MSDEPRPAAPISWAYAAVLGQTFIASCTFLVAKAGMEELDPWQLISLRVLCGAPVLLFLLRRFGRSLSGSDHRKLMLLGILGIPLNQGLFLWGLQSTTPTRAALLYAMTPLVVAVAAHFLLGERLRARRVLGISIALAGVVVVLLGRGLSFDGVQLRGDLLVLAGVVCWGLYSVLGKRLVARHGALAVTAASLLYGTLWMVPVEVWALWGLDVLTLGAQTWGSVFFLAFITSIGSYLLWYYALGRLPAARVTIFMNLQPVLTAALAVALWDESLTLPLCAGGVLVLGGVIVVQRG